MSGDCLISLLYGDKTYDVKYHDFSSKSSFHEVQQLPHSFHIKIDPSLNPNSVESFVAFITKRELKIDADNVMDLSYLAHRYGFYTLFIKSYKYLQNNVPIYNLFEIFSKKSHIENYTKSFEMYISHNLQLFVKDGSFYKLPIDTIIHIFDQHKKNITNDDTVTFTINCYFIHGSKALQILKFIDLEKCSTQSLIHLFCILSKEKPFPFYKYISILLKKRQIKTPNHRIVEKKQNLENLVNSIVLSIIKATQENPNEASKMLIKLYEEKLLQNPSMNTLAFLFDRIANSGDGDSLFKIYKYYHDGIGVKVDQKKALHYLEMAYKNNSKEACLILAKQAMSHRNFPDLPSDQFNILKKAADLGDAQSQYSMGVVYANSRKYSNNLSSIHYLIKAKLNGHPKAERSLVKLSALNNEKTVKEAKNVMTKYSGNLELLKQAADAEYPPAILLYSTKTPSRKEAKKYLKKGMNLNLPQAFTNLGYYYMKTIRKNRHISRMISYLTLATETSQKEGMFYYGQTLLNGWSGFQNVDLAISYIEASAELNCIPAIKMISKIYRYGKYVSPNYAIVRNALQKLYQIKEPEGSCEFIYLDLLSSFESQQLKISQINEKIKALKSFADSGLPRGIYYYTKVILDKRFMPQIDYKTALYYLKKIDNYVPCAVINISINSLFYDVDLSAFEPILQKFSDFGDPTFRYKYGSYLIERNIDPYKGFELIRQSAYSNSPCGMMKYGLLLIEGRIRERNVFEALEFFKKAGLLGFDLGFVYYAKYGIEYPEIRNECVEYVRRVAEKGNINATICYASCLMKLGTTFYSEAIHILKPRAVENNPEALFYYAKALLTKNDTQNQSRSDLVTALEYLRMSYISGFHNAIVLYVDTLIKLNDLKTAVEFLTEQLYNSSYALYKLSAMTFFGIQTKMFPDQAIDILKLSVLCNDPDGLWKYGTMLRDGFYVAKDLNEAIKCFQKSAALGNIKAKICLGNILLTNKKNSKKDHALAFCYFSEAAKAGNRTGLWCKAMCMLKGIGCMKNVHEAIQIFRFLSSNGDKDAQYQLGKIILNGVVNSNNLPPNELNYYTKMAFDLWQNAARAGHTTAIWRLGVFIFNGKYFQQDVNSATQYFKQSADLGNPQGAELYAYCLYNGIGVLKNIEQANYYSEIAAKRNHNELPIYLNPNIHGF
ncbi:hypothetical protein TRFO_40527 [Tritrichomonas foetus]|uniref:Sel1 repeat family protein n=1 Tax=Tritrichomonas foetus TaxID=1144522 RepID=A0A1J4J0I5_9EUKA|nr:hypothetical protein TRFO_40527 [Tritrichomonas foetus]|eukprot:OHS93150.1 hypothetical protein TRFO_40527 [Tritrichomonas foetus]